MNTTNDSHQQKHPKMDDPDETEDTLSLCDLPIYSESFSDEYRTSCSDQNLFEFHSEEFSSSTNSNSSSIDTIMFCGKLIPYKQEEPISKSQTKTKTKTTGKSSSKRRDGSGDPKLSGSNSTRWYFFMFGLSRCPPVIEMSLSDMKRRQSRRVPDPVVQSDVVGLRRNKGLWGMIRYLGCVGRNDVVKVSFGCMPRV